MKKLFLLLATLSILGCSEPYYPSIICHDYCHALMQRAMDCKWPPLSEGTCHEAIRDFTDYKCWTEWVQLIDRYVSCSPLLAP